MRRIFVIEDDQFIREAILELLELEGYQVASAKNGQDGIDTLRAATELPDVILLDLMMPVKDGFAFRAEQMEDPRLNTIPVVIMSADGNVEEKKSRTRASAYLKKPVELEEVLRAVERAATQGAQSPASLA